MRKSFHVPVIVVPERIFLSLLRFCNSSNDLVSDNALAVALEAVGATLAVALEAVGATLAVALEAVGATLAVALEGACGPWKGLWPPWKQLAA